MWVHRATHAIGNAFQGRLYQCLAIMFCVLFGVAMIVNTQLQGEAWWFWYAQLFHNGARLYADLHMPLQPLYALETNAWIRMFGTKCLVTEIPSLIHVLAFCLGIFLILRESDWPDWQKAIVLAGAFLICVECSAERFDDVHIVMDTFTYFSVVLLLLLPKAKVARWQFGIAIGLGVISGLAITTRPNDGGALLVAAGICMLFLTKNRKMLLTTLFVVSAVSVWILVVRMTGDSFSDYVSNSIVHAAGPKGGVGTIFAAPFIFPHNAFQALHGRKWLFLWTVAIIMASALVQHYWKGRFRYLVALQLGMAGFAYVFSSWLHRAELREGAFFSFVSLSLVLVSYLLLPAVAGRYLLSKAGQGKREWDSREILFLIPLAELASTAASTQASVSQLFWSPIALLLLLVVVTQPFRRQASWANPTLVTIMALMGLTAMAERIHNPYAWLHFQSKPMFVERQWYQHPVYGPMYLDSDLLHFIEPLCREIQKGNSKAELLSMPWSYPNYFCAAPPWHGYVQTFYDTTAPSTIHQLMRELDSAPPQWIVYMRDMDDLASFERRNPLPYRDLDRLITQKIQAGQWHVVEKNGYLFRGRVDQDDAWYLIRTQPLQVVR